MENQKLRIWWRKLDEEGNEIERGVDDREYVSFGHACNRAEKLFGPRIYRHNKTLEWRIALRDPWAKYTCEVTCSVCGQVFISEEHAYHEGYPVNSDSVHLYTKSGDMAGIVDGRRPDYNGYCCPDCAVKIHNFISGLRKG
jgi:hypothetical protein